MDNDQEGDNGGGEVGDDDGEAGKFPSLPMIIRANPLNGTKEM